MTVSPQAARWAASLVPAQFRHLFDGLPGTMLFAKDARFRLMLGNDAFVRRCGFEREEQLVGLTDDRIFPAHMAAKYRRDDEAVRDSGKPRFGLIELFPNADGRPEWYVTDKVPLFGRSGAFQGLCGTVRSYEGQRAALQPYLELAEVAEHLKRNLQQPLDTTALARMAGVSVRQFTRKFQVTFRTTPRAYLMQMRVMRACELLARSTLPITRIALEAGFYDHADLARHFHRQMGQTASAYRAAARAAQEA
ncbi:MAG: helix-turn-helix domain-containing protein [Planctomycetota bacterium]